MPQNITPVATWTSPIRAPSPGESATAANLINLFLQPITNCLEWLKVAIGHGKIVAVANKRTTTDQSTTQYSWTDVPDSTLTLSGLLTGDIIQVNGHAVVVNSSPTKQVWVGLRVVDNGTRVDDGASEVALLTSGPTVCAGLTTQYTAAHDNDITVGLRFMSDNGGVAIIDSYSFNVIVYRP
jgi:hypothetical protein